MNEAKKRIETLNIKRIRAMDEHIRQLTQKIVDYNNTQRVNKRNIIEKQLHAIGRYFNLN